jgi:predicted transcriptional regulator of viral defense system
VTPRTPRDGALVLLKKRGIVRSRDLERHGISRTQIRRLREQGLIEQVGRGLYTLPGAVLTEQHSLAEAAQRVPGGVVCLLSALRFHGLTTQNPSDVWMAIDRKAWRPRAGYPRLRLVYLSSRALQEGAEEHDVGGVRVRVFSAAKTVADCFKYRNKVGVDVAVEALRDFSRRHRGGATELARFARICRVTRVMQPYLDAIA